MFTEGNGHKCYLLGTDGSQSVSHFSDAMFIGVGFTYCTFNSFPFMCTNRMHKLRSIKLCIVIKIEGVLCRSIYTNLKTM